MSEKQKAILLLTGDPDLNEHIEKIFAYHDQLVLHADSSLRAILKIISYDFSLLIIDFELDNICFDDLIKIVKRLDAELPVFVILEEITEETLSRLIECDILDYVVKPTETIGAERILELIDRYQIKNSRLQQINAISETDEDDEGVVEQVMEDDVDLSETADDATEPSNGDGAAYAGPDTIEPEIDVYENVDNETYQEQEEKFLKDLFDENDISFEELVSRMSEMSCA